MQVLQVILLSITQTGLWGTAGQEFDAFSAVEGWLTGFAMAALIISLILVFFLSANHKRSLDSFKRQIDGITTANEQMRQEITELSRQTVAEVS